MGSERTRLELNRLRIFLEATRSGNYTAAGRRLHLTPSAVSHAIRTLEDAAGRRLIEWRHRRLVLTDEGDYVREVCERVFQDLDQAEHVLTTRAAGGTQAITIGATVEFGTTVLVRKLRPLLEAAPWLRLNFRLGDDLEPLLLRDEIDIAVDCASHTHPSLTATRLFREKYPDRRFPTVPPRAPRAAAGRSRAGAGHLARPPGRVVVQRAAVGPRPPAARAPADHRSQSGPGHGARRARGLRRRAAAEVTRRSGKWPGAS